MDGVQGLDRVKVQLFQGDHRPAGQHGADGRDQARAVHQGRGDEAGGARAHQFHRLDQLIQRLRHGAEQLGRQDGQHAQVVGRPHHALGHAGGAAGIDEHHVVGAALDAERLPVAGLAQGFETLRAVAALADLDEDLHLGQAVLDRVDVMPELLAVNHDRGVGIVEDVIDFFRCVAIVHIHMHQPRLEAGGQQLTVFGPVVHVEGDLVAEGCAPGQDCARQVVGAAGRIAPGDDFRAMNIGGGVGRNDGRDAVKNVAVIPLEHAAQLPGSFVMAPTGRAAGRCDYAQTSAPDTNPCATAASLRARSGAPRSWRFRPIRLKA